MKHTGQHGTTPSALERLLAGTIGPAGYFVWGMGLLLLKWLVDTQVALRGFNRAWSPAYYLIHEQAVLAFTGEPDDRFFFGVMLLTATPFVIAGLVLTVRRLRSAGWPVWLALLFFVPLVHLLFFIMLSVAPRRARRPEEEPLVVEADGDAAASSRFDSFLPRRPAARGLTSIGVSIALGLLLTGFNVYALGVYGFGLFVGLPFCLGMISVVIHGGAGMTGCGQAIGVAIATVFGVGAVMFVAAMEGAVCLVMAAPIWIAVAALGGMVGFSILRHARSQRDAALVAGVLAVALPALMGAERALTGEAPQFAVHSEVMIAAPPERVWPAVIEFPPLAEPREWFFRAGVAYPTHAVIQGCGVGAERHCVFSTGAFVEPIEVWDEPAHLAFSVTENPPAMRELSLYEGLDPPHLHGFFTARRGEFRLTATPEGGTRLEGTTWYQHHMRPALYWRLWSDAMIHRIHLRVLEHIRAITQETPHEKS